MIHKKFGSSGLSGVISGNRDKNVPTIVVSASQTADSIVKQPIGGTFLSRS